MQWLKRKEGPSRNRGLAYERKERAAMRTKKKKKFAGVLTLAMLSSALMVDGPPAFAASEGVVVCALQGRRPQAPLTRR